MFDIDPVVDVKVVPHAPLTLTVVETVWLTSGGMNEKSTLYVSPQAMLTTPEGKLLAIGAMFCADEV